MKELKRFIESGKNFAIKKFRNLEIINYEIAFGVLMQIDKIMNDNFLSLSEDDFDDFKKDNKIDLVLGTQGYSAKFLKNEGVLKMVFAEGGLE